MQKNLRCPCHPKRLYARCCGLLHEGERDFSAEALMRSRYSAYVLANVGYLLESWHPDTRPQQLDLADNPKWKGLHIVRAEELDAQNARVEFVARYQVGKKNQRLHEISHFQKLAGLWKYLDGELL